MKLTYQTAIATLIQFVTLTLLGIPNALVSIISTCHSDNSNCVSNMLVSLIFFLLTAAWFGFVWLLGYAAQERRSKRLAWLLIGAEALTAAVALFNTRHDTNFLTIITSLLDLLLAIWIMVLAFRLIRAKGGRVVVSQRQRQRRSKHLNTPEL